MPSHNIQGGVIKLEHEALVIHATLEWDLVYVKERAVLNSIEEEMSIIAWSERRGSKSAEGGGVQHVHTCSVMMEKPTELTQ